MRTRWTDPPHEPVRTLPTRSPTGALGGGLLALSCALCACPRTATKPPSTTAAGEAKRTRVEEGFRIRSFSEPYPFTALAVHGPHLYAGTRDGVVRFDIESGAHVRLTKDQGMAGDRVTALSARMGRGLWVATQAGVSRFHNGVWSNLPLEGAPTRPFSALVTAAASVWTGGPDGVGRLKGDSWTRFLPGVRVTRLMVDDSGDGDGVWVGTDGEGIYRFEEGKFVAHSLSRGQVLRVVRDLGTLPDGAVVALGRAAEGERLAYFDGRHWTTYTLRPSSELRWISRVGARVVIATHNRVLELRREDLTRYGRPKSLPKGPVVLTAHRSTKAPPRYPLPYLYTAAVDESWLPARPTVVTQYGGRILVGTRASGALIYDGEQTRWYRTQQLTGAGDKLKVACSGALCFVASGAGKAYLERDNSFVRVSVDTDAQAKAQAFARQPDGQVVALHSLPGSRALSISRWDGKTFVRQRSFEVGTPGGRPVAVRFAAFAPNGALWVGLFYVDEEGENRPWGLAVLQGNEAPVFHRSTLLPGEERLPGSLALPDDVRGVLFEGEQVWLATDAGACRLRGVKVDLFTENEGLESELVYDLAASRRGEILAATYAGVGRFDGKLWRFDLGEPLSQATRSVAYVDDVLWAGTDRGLLRVRDGELRRLRTADGMAGDRVLDLKVDGRGRLWALTDSGLSIIER